MDPREGSEPGRAFKMVVAIANDPRVTRCMVMVPDWKGSIDASRKALNDLNLSRVELLPLSFATTNRAIAESPLRYLLYHRLAADIGKNARRFEKDFDVFHQINFAGFRFVSNFFRVEAAKVWGPISATEPFPLRQAWRYLSQSGRLYYVFYNALNWASLSFSPRVRAAVRKVDAILFATSRDYERIRGQFQRTNTLDRHLPEIALSTTAGSPQNSRPMGPVRMVWAGAHIDRKGFPLLIEALGRLGSDEASRIQLDVYGAGRHTRAWQAALAKHAPNVHVAWHGVLPQKVFSARLSNYDVMAITSFREANSNVLAEARFAKLAIIALEVSGYRDLVGGEKEWLVGLDQGDLADRYALAVRAARCAVDGQPCDPAPTPASRVSLLTEEQQGIAIVDVYAALMAQRTLPSR